MSHDRGHGRCQNSHKVAPMLVKMMVKEVRAMTQQGKATRSHELWSGLEWEPAKGFEPLACGLRTPGNQFFEGYQRPSALIFQGVVFVFVLL